MRGAAGTWWVALCMCWAGSAMAESVVVDTPSGPLVGTRSGEVLAFKGIRYAAAVTGENRWRPPQPVASWEKPRDARNFGPACPQPARRDRPSGITSTAEDCLLLNVWSFVGADKAPVMVWIHGGAFRIGSASQAVYDGASFAQKGVILVSLNYRLGRLGFFAHPALEESGNFGLMDQAAALGWVQTHVAAFGGDPDNVTIFGESAGGVSVLHLLTSPRTEGLFAKAVLQSGGGHQLNGHLHRQRVRKPSLRAQGRKFADGRTTAAELRAIPVAEVLGGSVLSGVAATAPVIDEEWVPGDPGVRLAQGDFHRVPILVGANSNEASVLQAFGISAEQALEALPNFDLSSLPDLYSGSRAAALAWGDMAFVAGARHIAASAAQFDVPVYLYHFDYVLKRRRQKTPGANHGSDVIFVFNSLARIPYANALVTRADEKYAERIQDAWVRFATHGDPNGKGLPAWPRYSQASDTLMFFGTRMRTEAEFRKAQLDHHQARWNGVQNLLRQFQGSLTKR